MPQLLIEGAVTGTLGQQPQQPVVGQEDTHGGQRVRLPLQERERLPIEYGQQLLLLLGQIGIAAVVDLLELERALFQLLAIVVLPGLLLPAAQHLPRGGGKVIGGLLHQKAVHLFFHQPAGGLERLGAHPGQQLWTGGPGLAIEGGQQLAQQILPLPHGQGVQQGVDGGKLPQLQPAGQIVEVTLQPLVGHQCRPGRLRLGSPDRQHQQPAQQYQEYMLHDVPILVTSRFHTTQATVK